MSYNIKTISVFERQAKRLMKKFPSLKKEIQELIKELKEEPEKGISFGHNCYKIRFSIASKAKGKSGGARVITHLVLKDDTVSCEPFTINRTLKTLPTKKFWSL